MQTKPVNLQAVAKASGYSATTVSRVLNGSSIPTEQTRRKVLEVLQALDYQPNRAGSRRAGRSRPRRRYRGAATRTIGLLSSREYHQRLIQDGYYASIAHSFQLALEAEGFHVMLATAEPNDPLPEIVRQRRVDAILLRAELSAEQLEQLRQMVPVVLGDRIVDGVCIDAVLADIETATTCQLQYLWDLGHRRIACFEQSTPVAHQRMRRTAYMQFFTDRPAPDLEPALMQPWDIRTHTHDQVMDAYVDVLMRADPRPTALLSSNNYAASIMRRLQQRGVAVPEQISILGTLENMPGGLTTPGLTSYRISPSEIGRSAAELVLQRLEEPDRPSRVVRVQGSPLVRESCCAVEKMDRHANPFAALAVT